MSTENESVVAQKITFTVTKSFRNPNNEYQIQTATYYVPSPEESNEWIVRNPYTDAKTQKPLEVYTKVPSESLTAYSRAFKTKFKTWFRKYWRDSDNPETKYDDFIDAVTIMDNVFWNFVWGLVLDFQSQMFPS